ncbi:MFS transporter [Pseudonocardia sp. DSM 110487]|uniref:MFS transporter n=1 Tax=Pseudonocardia sp. DSM 110487 TaxID=2865833 RepID=UPI001C6A538F|nr:MFS transporter [Pseudonocardia sp. DSM 110487]QYN35537.1 MFS transporter [Pseudonocardia sp. DSM 110487]
MTATDGRWYGSMSPRERRTFWACFGGWATDAMDVQIYSLLIPTLISVGLLVSNAQAGLIGTVTLLCSAVGGWAAGVLSDRFGRALLLQVTVAWFSVFTLLCAFAQDFTQLLVFRGLMGFGFGGEWAVGAILMGETVRAQFRGRAVGTVQSGWAVGWGIAVGLFVLTQSLLPPETAWRVLFALGVLPALGVFWIRRHVPEPDVFVRHTDRSADRPSFLGIFRPGLLRTTVVCGLLCTGAQGGYYALTTFLPQFLRSARGLDVLGIGGTLLLVIVGALTGYLFGAWLTDRLGRRPAIIVCAVAAFVIVLPMTLFNLPTAVFTVLALPLGFVASAYFSGLGALLTEQYPTELRGSGQGFCYNFGRGLGALFPLFVGLLADALSIGVAIAVFAGLAYLVMALCALLLPETRGAELTGATS